MLLTALAGVLSGQSVEPASSPTEVFDNQARLPVDLYTADGTLLAAGAYRVRVRLDEGRPVLVFVTDDDARTEVQPLPTTGDAEEPLPSIPITGTLFLRSSEDPVGTDAERHHSKTGHAQYHETTRDWKAALRMYRHADAGRNEVLVLFQRRRPWGPWDEARFQLLLERP